jgi:Family of unknown function (DUF6157)
VPTHTTNYQNTFIEVADDCPVSQAEIPPLKGDKRSAANIQFDMLHGQPYTYTSDDAIFGTFAEKNNITKQEYASVRTAFFAKGQPCMRASPLTKRYGWGVHCDAKGRIALVASGSAEYRRLAKDPSLKHLKAMRSARG